MTEYTREKKRTSSNRRNNKGSITTESQPVGSMSKLDKLYTLATEDDSKNQHKRQQTTEKVRKNTNNHTSERKAREFVSGYKPPQSPSTKQGQEQKYDKRATRPLPKNKLYTSVSLPDIEKAVTSGSPVKIECPKTCKNSKYVARMNRRENRKAKASNLADTMASTSDVSNSCDERNAALGADTISSISKPDTVSPKVSTNNRKVKTNNKPTLLYIILCDEDNVSIDCEGYFRQRVGKKYSNDFKIQQIETTNHKNYTKIKVTLSFESRAKAIKARGAFLTGNKHFDKKVSVYFNDVDKNNFKVSNTTERHSRLEQHRKIMFDMSEQVLKLHEIKMRVLKEERTKLEKQLKGGKLSISAFESTKAETTAIDGKLRESELQNAEFNSYTENLYRQLDEISKSPKPETEINKLRTEFGVECSRLSNALPIYARRSDILEVIRNHQVTVLIGETGSGKSTQIPQYLLQAGYAKDGLIVCTQPRKVAAVTLATRVSREMATQVGQSIGYHVGMKAKRTNLTKVLYVTDHILLNECLKDKGLKKFSCIIIDEAHERSIFTDMLLGMIKSAMVKRPALKIVITSATISPDSFVSYFGGAEICPVLKVSGRNFPVEEYFCKPEDDKNPFEGYINTAVQKCLELHNSNPLESGDILVFLPTPLEVEKCLEEFRLCCRDERVQCLPLHGKLQANEQANVFQATPPNKRKVVVATNCAETSITIPGVKFVVDTGLAKEMNYDSKRNINSLQVCMISKSSAEQRRGRAGRTAPGKCYRLYNKTVYSSMQATSKPEILRVHLGQALLQLMILGIDPLLFDFVEAPPHEAMESAMQSLTDIGAVAGGNITDVGRWLSKLPLDPRKGYLVKLGIDDGIPMEALVVAACGGETVFYRFGTEKEKKIADVKKLKFCHNEGDILTNLNVYREWDKVPERQKGKWCFDNCINAKSMRSARELVNEIRIILKKEMKQDLPYEMKSSTDTDAVLKRILIRVLKHNVCVFLGHEKAGFYGIHNQQRVQMHPSSVLKPLNIQPDILVYENRLRTSRDFITGITPVDKIDLIDLSPEILLSYRAALENIRVSLVGTFYCGKKVTRTFIGPLHKNRMDVEEQLNEASENKTIVLDVHKEKGEIQLFTSNSDKQHSIDQLRYVLTKLTTPFQQRCMEINVGKSDDVRVVLGAGYSVKDVLMPDQFRTIMIKKKLLSAEEPDVWEVENIFSSFGNTVEIKQCVRAETKNRGNWGTVTFSTGADAKTALSLINARKDRYFEAHPFLPRSQSSTGRGFKIKISWCRRPAKGIAYVHMTHHEDFVGVLLKRKMLINGSIISIVSSERREEYDTSNQLLLKGLPHDVIEEEIKYEIADRLNIPDDEINLRIKRVVIPRETVETSPVMFDAICDKISRNVLKYAKMAKFEILFLPDPREKPKCARYTVLIKFKQTHDGISVLNGMQKRAHYFGGYPAQVTAELETSIAIQQNIFEAVRDDLEPTVQSIATTFPNINININHSKSGKIFVNIKANDPNKLARVKVLVHAILQGDALECGRDNKVSKLFTTDGRAAMRDIERCIGSAIFVDNRTMSVIVQGTQERRTRSVVLINQYLDGLASLSEKVISLKGAGQPAGLMKEIVVNYFEQMAQLSGVRSLDLHYMEQQISILGDEESIVEAEKLICEASVGLQANRLTKAPDIPDCFLCFCPVEPNDMYRIECCGHPYCKECVKQQIRSAVQHKTFPIVCASENCDQAFVIEDLNSLILEGCTTQSDLVKASIADFVGRNNTAYHYCITPDCDMIYEITKNGLPFTCGQCHETMCTSCHIQYHDGITCSMYLAEKQEENKIDMWLRENPDKRKLCPKCRTPIEKSEGCNHMNCETCRIHFCWICLQTFNAVRQCYGHLKSVHGSFS